MTYWFLGLALAVVWIAFLVIAHLPASGRKPRIWGFSFKRKPCDGIEAVFVHGVLYCNNSTHRRVLLERRFYPFCKEHQ